jgi:hypothetical protein
MTEQERRDATFIGRITAIAMLRGANTPQQTVAELYRTCIEYFEEQAQEPLDSTAPDILRRLKEGI